jgi:hypothetical protein
MFDKRRWLSFDGTSFNGSCGGNCTCIREIFADRIQKNLRVLWVLYFLFEQRKWIGDGLRGVWPGESTFFELVLSPWKRYRLINLVEGWCLQPEIRFKRSARIGIDLEGFCRRKAVGRRRKEAKRLSGTRRWNLTEIKGILIVVTTESGRECGRVVVRLCARAHVRIEVAVRMWTTRVIRRSGRMNPRGFVMMVRQVRRKVESGGR